MNFPDDDTGHVLADMKEAGIDLSACHEIVFFQLFEQQAQAQLMADFIKETMPEIRVNLHPDETPNVWDLDCTLAMVATYEAIVTREEQFGEIAAKFEGYNDGWGIEA